MDGLLQHPEHGRTLSRAPASPEGGGGAAQTEACSRARSPGGASAAGAYQRGVLPGRAQNSPTCFSFFFFLFLKRKSEKTKIARPKINKQKCPPCGRTSNYRKSWAPRPQELDTPRLQKSLSSTLVQPQFCRESEKDGMARFFDPHSASGVDRSN